MSPTQKKVAAVVTSLVIVGAIAAHDSKAAEEMLVAPDKCPTPPSKSGIVYMC